MTIREFIRKDKKTKEILGTERHYYNEEGQRDRKDGPAIEYVNGDYEYFIDDVRHRLDGPAKVRTKDGKTDYEWFKDGKHHCIGGPAITLGNGTKEWKQNGIFHNLEGPAIEYANGDRFWYGWGMPASFDDQPSIILANGTKVWYSGGKKGRDNGPSVVRADGTKEWYWIGRKVTELEHCALTHRSYHTGGKEYKVRKLSP